MEHNYFQKIIASITTAFLVFNCAFFYLFSPLTVYGQEVISPVPEEQTTPTPEQSQSTITTGDTTSQATTQTETATTSEAVDGAITSEGCDVNGTIACPVSEDNTSNVSTDTSSESSSGLNSNTNPSGDTTTNTGDASSNAITEDVVNTTTIEASPSAQEQTGLEMVNTETQDPDKTNSIDIDNTASLDSQTASQGVSGQNNSEASSQSTTTTGDAISTSTAVTMANINLIGSDFEFMLIDILKDQQGEIDLNEVYKKLQEKIAEKSAQLANTSIGGLSIEINNNANITTNATATALSGENTGTANSVEISSGNAYASSSIFNLVNLNLVGSNFIFAIINIFANYEGDIILPNIERFMQESQLQPGVNQNTEYSINNTAQLATNATALSDSGNNQIDTGKIESVSTGDATAISTQTLLTNQNIFLSRLFMVFINNFGIWNGSIFSWSNPSDKTTQEATSGQYQNMSSEPTTQQPSLAENSQQQTQGDMAIQSENIPPRFGSKISINNNAQVSLNAFAQALCGGNTASGNRVSIYTGTCSAMTNIFSMINTNIIGSNIILPIINIMGRGNWKGNLIFAYPDLVISINSNESDIHYGDNVSYQIGYVNQGHETARSAQVSIELPPGARVTGTSGNVTQQNGSQIIFNVGDVQAHQSGTVTISITFDKDALSQKTTVLDQLIALVIQPAYAQESEKMIVVSTNIRTSDAETNTDNNHSSTTQYIIDSPSQKNEGVQAQEKDPDLSVNSNNNVGAYVYPKDTIRFQAESHNAGGAAQQVQLVQEIYDENNNFITRQVVPIGSLSSLETKKISFGLVVPSKAPAGAYTSVIFISGYNQKNAIFYSKDSITSFAIKSKGLIGFNVVKPVSAALPQNKGGVLGATSSSAQKKDYIPYVLGIMFAMLWFVENRKRIRLSQELEKALTSSS